MSEGEFTALFEAHGAAETAKILGINERNVDRRRRRIEEQTGQPIYAPSTVMLRRAASNPARIMTDIDSGVVLIGSDCHYWPGVISTAHRAFVRACRELRPHTVIMNGDVFDGATISRHPALGWENKPSVIDELDTCKARLDEIKDAAHGAQRIWTLGNHDARFEMRLASVAPEFAKVHGVHLKDHFPDWAPCWSAWINDEVVVKHRWKGGIHATHNNTVGSGKTMVTGHLHSLKVTPYDDYNGTRYGVDTGTLANPWGPQFDYTEDNPRNHRSGFVVLTFHKGELLPPELVQVKDEAAGEVTFRGRVWTV